MNARKLWVLLALCGCSRPQVAAIPDAGPPVAARPAEVTLLITGAENGYLLPNPDDQGVNRGGAAELLGRWIKNHGHCAGRTKPDGAGACEDASTLVLSTGDNGNGASISSYFRAVPAAEAMGAMGYAASAFGNRELDFGRQQFILNSHTGGYSYLAADLRAKDDDARALGLVPMKIFNRRGARIAVIGLTSKKSITTLMAGRSAGFEVLEDEVALGEAVPKAQAAADAIVVITDGCLGAVAPIVEKHPEWKLAVVAGRACDGTFGEKAGTAVLAYPGRHFNDYVAVTLSFSASHALTKVSGEAVEVVNDANAPPPEPGLARLVASWRVKRDAALGEEIGFLKGKLEQTDPAMSLWLGAAIKEQTKSDFGLLNRKGMRQGLAAGKLTKANVYDVVPFENSVVVAKLNGADLVKAFDNPEARVVGAVKKGTTWRDSKGAAIDPARPYTVATVDFLYFGGDNFELEKHDLGPNFTGMGWQTTVIEWTRKLATSEKLPLEDALKGH